MLSDTAGRCGYKKAQDRANTSYVTLNTKVTEMFLKALLFFIFVRD